MPEPTPGPPLRLRPGVRVARRGDGQLQVGLHADQRLVVGESDDVRRLLRDLAHGVRADAVPHRHASLVAALVDRDLVLDRDDPPPQGAVDVVAPDPARQPALRMLAAAEVPVVDARAEPAVALHVGLGAEPRRAELDAWMRDGLPHLTLVVVAGRTRLGPLVDPGRTACLRCVDEHLTDRDPRHPLVLEQHHATDPRDLPPPADLQLALAWAAHDLHAWLRGRTPQTWSATVELGGPDGPVVRTWRRHPRCGCAWGDLLAG